LKTEAAATCTSLICGNNGVEEELTAEGSEIKVTEANKYQFICVKIDFVTREIVENQLIAMKKGFLSLIKKEWVK